MSNGSQIKVELEALSDVRYQLLKTQESFDNVFAKAQKAITDEASRLDEILQKRQQNVEQCDAAYQSCISQIDEEGRRPSCSAELAALQQAQLELQKIQTHISRYQAETDQAVTQLHRYQQSLSGSIDGARNYLHSHIAQTLRYLWGQNVALPKTPGQRSHGSEYDSARRRFFREGAAGDFLNEPSHLRGWMRQEVNEGGGYYHSPPGYNVGHYIRNLNIPENYRWELAEMNQGRAILARNYQVNNF